MDLALTSLAAGGEAVGRYQDFVFFVPDGAPGDAVRAQVTEVRKNYGRARIVEVLSPSPDRAQAPCQYFGECGGCQLQHLTYEAQLRYKTQVVLDAIRHVGRLKDVEVKPCLGMDHPWAYRNKAQFVVGEPFAVGLYQRHSHRVVSIDVCPIQSELNNRVLRVAERAVRQAGWSAWNEDTGSGLLRHIVTRTSSRDDQVVVALVVSRREVPHLDQVVSRMRDEIPALRGLVLNLNDRPGNTVMGPEFMPVWGQDYLEEAVEGLSLHVSVGSFFQVNYRMLHAMLRLVDEHADLQGHETVLDAFCGTGILALHVARRASRVLGIEEVEQAIQDARQNAERNGLSNVEFRVGRVEDELPGLPWRFDVAMMDPPRKGCHPAVLATFATARVPRLVYVSCNPVTLARDLGWLSEHGYRVGAVQPFDMFPQTSHVESIVRLEHEG